MQRVFNDQNLDRYKKLASGTLTIAERKIIFDCLAQERADFRNHAHARSEGAHVPAEKTSGPGGTGIAGWASNGLARAAAALRT